MSLRQFLASHFIGGMLIVGTPPCYLFSGQYSMINCSIVPAPSESMESIRRRFRKGVERTDVLKEYARSQAFLPKPQQHRVSRKGTAGERSRGGAPNGGSASAFKAFAYTNAFGYSLTSSEPVGSPASVTVANGVYSFGSKTYTSEFPSSP